MLILSMIVIAGLVGMLLRRDACAVWVPRLQSAVHLRKAWTISASRSTATNRTP